MPQITLRLPHIIAGLTLLMLLLTSTVLYRVFWQPLEQPSSTFAVTAGSSVRDVASAAANEGHIRSSLAFLIWYQLNHASVPIFAGYYQLPPKASIADFVAIMTSGDTEESYTAVTFPEGITIETMANIIRENSLSVDIDEYRTLLEGQEGYVFPDTYYLTADTTATDLATIQTNAFRSKIAPYRERIEAHPLDELEVITLASIIEREANDETSMKMVSGILQNRLAIDMPLQADASIEYVLDKPLQELTPADLDIDSPYNTYLYRGLPPTPINNPGIAAIEAVLEPTPSDFYYYITGRDGQFYYARTLDAHNENIAKHLR